MRTGAIHRSPVLHWFCLAPNLRSAVRLRDFFAELQRRNVYKVAVAYLGLPGFRGEHDVKRTAAARAEDSLSLGRRGHARSAAERLLLAIEGCLNTLASSGHYFTNGTRRTFLTTRSIWVIVRAVAASIFSRVFCFRKCCRICRLRVRIQSQHYFWRGKPLQPAKHSKEPWHPERRRNRFRTQPAKTRAQSAFFS